MLNEEINKMDKLQKLSIYMDYYITQLGLKYNFHIFPKYIENWNNGIGNADKESVNFAQYYHWKGIKIKTFEEFISEDNIVVSDNGDNWGKNGNAQRIRTDYFGIYDWYAKFKNRIVLC